MRQIILYILISSFFYTAHSQWLRQNPKITAYTLNSVMFVNDQTGWAVGENSTLLKSTDGGKNWVNLSLDNGLTLRKALFLNLNKGWIVGDDGIILYSSNGGYDWTIQSEGKVYRLNDVEFLNDTLGWVFGQDHGGVIGKTADGGQTWTTKLSGISTLFSVSFIDESTGWAVGNWRILKTADGGNNWSLYQLPFSNRLKSVVFVNEQTGWTVGQYAPIYKTTDSGNTWFIQYDSINTVRNSIVFLDENTGWTAGSRSIYETTNGGDNWIKNDLPLGGISIYSITFASQNNGWFVGSQGKVFYSNDGGTNWWLETTPTNSGLRAVQFINDTVGWSVGYGGTIIKTTDAGVGELTIPSTPILLYPPNNSPEVFINDNIRWTQVGDVRYRAQIATDSNFVNVVEDIQTFATYSGLSNLNLSTKYFWRVLSENLAGNSGWSEIWNFKTASYVLDIKDEKQITSFNLTQNYPNPFNPSTTIEFNIPQMVYVKLKIFDILGNEIKTLINKELPSGNYKVEFLGNSLPSGVYFYRLSAGSFVETKKMILLR